eukprot:scaffold4736_cov118-Isochrysis_galbana.AAC.7
MGEGSESSGVSRHGPLLSMAGCCCDACRTRATRHGTVRLSQASRSAGWACRRRSSASFPDAPLWPGRGDPQSHCGLRRLGQQRQTVVASQDLIFPELDPAVSGALDSLGVKGLRRKHAVLDARMAIELQTAAFVAEYGEDHAAELSETSVGRRPLRYYPSAVSVVG